MSSDDTRPLRGDLGFEPRPEDTAALRVDDRSTAPGADRSPEPTTATATAEPTTTATAPAPTYRQGPAPFGLFLGVVGLVLAGAVLLYELTDVSVPWADLGPWIVVAGGLLVVLMGLLGLRASRSQH